MAAGAGGGSFVSDASHPANQIIIVRRNPDGEDAHHGGVWKIAFADFMTAMMAFFLVMWLTNASDDATKKKIAQYFNPIKLNSSTPESLGLNDGEASPSSPSSGSSGEVADGGDPNDKPMSGTANGGEEQALFRDPYAVLAEISAEGSVGKDSGTTGVPNGTGLPGAPTLGALVEKILRLVPELKRLRLSSLDSIEADPVLMRVIAEEERLMPHFHLSAQSGDDLILKRMKRRHLRADALKLVADVRAARPDIALGADLIAGFPTESDEA
ncbi:MAG: radical SAM protein, partial [Hyphomicrobiales bacterium]